WTADLVAALQRMAYAIAEGAGPRHRILHCVGGGQASWYDFAREIFTALGADPERVRPCSTAEFPRPAPRPGYSVLSTDRSAAAGMPRLRRWEDALAQFVTQHGDVLRHGAVAPRATLPDSACHGSESGPAHR